MATKKSGGLGKGLGRGFDALLPGNFDASLLTAAQAMAAPGEKIQQVPVASITPNSEQPRMEFDNEALAGLAASIARYGVLQPLIVTGQHQLIAGERRWRAAKLAGLTEVPVIVRSPKEHEKLELALIENVQRVDLSPLEQAASIERLHQQFNLSYEEIGHRLGKASSTVSNMARLLQLPPEAAEALRGQKISEGHARAILALKDYPDHQTELLRLIVANGWSVRQAERYVVGIKQGHAEKQAARARVDTETPATRRLAKRFGVPVQIRRTAKGGRLEISFTTDDELERIMDAITNQAAGSGSANGKK